MMEAIPTAIPAPAEARQSPRRPRARRRSRTSHLAGLATERMAVKTFWDRASKFGGQNLAAARAILEDPEKHGGEGAGLVVWARLTLRHEAERQAAA